MKKYVVSQGRVQVIQAESFEEAVSLYIDRMHIEPGNGYTVLLCAIEAVGDEEWFRARSAGVTFEPMERP